jgi:hypothetical protein
MELRILEAFAVLFLFLSIIRPLVRGLWKLDGLVACPLLALGIMVGIFPAYGFRPENIPLLFFSLFLTMVNMPDLTATVSGLQSDSYRDRGLLFTFGTALVFAFTLWIALYFAPPMEMELSTEGVSALYLQDRGRNTEFHLRVYGPKEAAISGAEPPVLRPLLVFLPPVAGSLLVSDAVCAALRDRGFTVLSYSRPNFDSPAFDQNAAPVRLFFPGLYRLINAISRGGSDAAANAGGRELEAERRQDTEFLLQELMQNKTLRDLLPDVDMDSIFLAGYGAGGAALTALSGNAGFTARYQQVRGIIAVESPLLSSLEEDALPPPLPTPGNPVIAFLFQARDFGKSFIPRKITHIGTVPQPTIPILFILSDKVIENRSGRYETVLRVLGASRESAILAAVPGSGPFDYSDSPRYYPIYSFLFRGHRMGQAAGPELTASLITNFAALFLESEEEESSPLTKTLLSNSIYLETGGVWNIPGGRTILQP